MFIRQSCKTWATLKFVQALLKPKASNHIVRVWLGYRITSQKNWDPTRWAPTIYKWNYKPYQWPDKWVARIFNPTQRGYIYIYMVTPPPWSTYKHFIWELPVFYAHRFTRKMTFSCFYFFYLRKFCEAWAPRRVGRTTRGAKNNGKFRDSCVCGAAGANALSTKEKG